LTCRGHFLREIDKLHRFLD
jgi:hypothetical protein